MWVWIYIAIEKVLTGLVSEEAAIDPLVTNAQLFGE
jgi:hypothetical protein